MRRKRRAQGPLAYLIQEILRHPLALILAGLVGGAVLARLLLG